MPFEAPGTEVFLHFFRGTPRGRWGRKAWSSLTQALRDVWASTFRCCTCGPSSLSSDRSVEVHLRTANGCQDMEFIGKHQRPGMALKRSLLVES